MTDLKTMAQRNRTICISSDEISFYQDRFLRLSENITSQEIENRTINQDLFTILDWLPISFVDLLFIDPPYNMTKSFNSNTFQERTTSEYAEWFDSWFSKLVKILKPTASVYICGDWRSSSCRRKIPSS